jgi:hypothetical protein
MRRKTAVVIAAAALIALGIVAFFTLDDSIDPARTAVVAAKTGNSAAPQAARKPGSDIPFSASRTPAPVDPAFGVAHKTAPPQPIPAKAPVRGMLAGLLQQAKAQPPSAEAAISAYELLTMCRRRASDPPKELDPNAPDCTGVSEADWADAPRLLKLAAELGNERAQLTYAQRLIGLGREPAELAPNREEMVAVQEKARQYLNTLAERGNVDGMWFLSESMRLGEISEPNLTMAYAYKYAVARAGGYPYTIDSELAQLESQLSPAEQAKARDFANQLIARCCTRK